MVGSVAKHAKVCLICASRRLPTFSSCHVHKIRALTKCECVLQSRLLSNVEAEPLVRAAWEHCFAVAPRSTSEVDAGAILHGKRRRSERH
jgi:hypothetical protein